MQRDTKEVAESETIAGSALVGQRVRIKKTGIGGLEGTVIHHRTGRTLVQIGNGVHVEIEESCIEPLNSYVGQGKA